MIEGFVTGDSETVAHLRGIGIGLERELGVAINRLTIMLQNMVKNDKLSGQVLGVRTGRLKRSIEGVVTQEGAHAEGVVSTALGYGIGWETGWQGGSVRADMKKSKAKFSPGAGGDTFQNGTPKMRSFLRSSLKDLESSGKIQTEMNAAAERAVK
jgi:hypothetical protein